LFREYYRFTITLNHSNSFANIFAGASFGSNLTSVATLSESPRLAEVKDICKAISTAERIIIF